ncbi:MAG: sulfatase [bacterium]
MKCILYILDSLRADHLSCYGYTRETSPHIDRLASEGVLFESAFAASTWTRPSAASILTGRYPLNHGVETFYSNLPAGVPRLAEILQRNGFACAAFSTIAQLSKAFGFGVGFEEFHELFRNEQDTADVPHLHEMGSILPSSEDLNAALFPWIENHADEDFFVLAWSIDPHVPYTIPLEQAAFLPEGARGQACEIDYKSSSHSPAELNLIKDLYDSCIYYNDQQIGRLCDFLHSLGIEEDTLLVVAGDHGEIFNEHLDPKNGLGEKIAALKKRLSPDGSGAANFYGRRGHIDVPPYDVGIHVPLIFKFPGNEFAGKRVANLVSLVDLAPTISRAANPGIDLSRYHFDGHNLLEWLPSAAGQSEDEVVFCSEKSYAHCPAYYCIRTHKWKYVVTEPPEFSLRQLLQGKWSYLSRFVRHRFLLANEVLYDLHAAGEQENVLARHPQVAAALRQRLEAWRKQCAEKRNLNDQGPETPAEVDEVNERQLKALGYMT